MADEHLEILLTLDANGYVMSAARVDAANKKLKGSLDEVDAKAKRKAAAIKNLNQSLGTMGTMYRSALGPIMAFGAAVAVATAGIAGMVTVGVQKYAAFENLENSLKAIEGGATEAKRAIEELRKIAEKPGLDFMGAASAYRALRMGGLSQKMSKEFVSELGNALLVGGAGPGALDRIQLQLGQVARAPFLQGDELKLLAENGLPAFQMIQRQFGTADTEKLKQMGITSTMVLAAILEEMKKMPRVQGGVTDAMTKLQDAFDKAAAQFGSEIAGGAGSGIRGISDAINELTDAGIWKDLGTYMMFHFQTLMDGLFGDAGDGTLSDAFIQMGGIVMDVTEALKNLALNLKDIYQIATFSPAKWVYEKISGAGSVWKPGMGPEEKRTLSPREQFVKDARDKLAELRAKMAEEKLTTETAKAEEEAKANPVAAKQIPLLREIANNTKPLRDIRDVIIGGGTFTQNAFNARNIGAWSGSQQRGLGLILKGIETFTLEQAYEMARNRAYSPSSV